MVLEEAVRLGPQEGDMIGLQGRFGNLSHRPTSMARLGDED